MQATPFEFRFRQVLFISLYLLGFFAPWERYTSLSLGARTWWLLLAEAPARAGWLTFAAATQTVLTLACLCTVLAVILRVWAAAYLGASVVHSAALQGGHVVADGPFRFVRNPLYLGTLLNVIGLSILMPPTGAVLAILGVALLERRLIGAEEHFLLKALGESYRMYCARVPRWVPALRPRVPSAGLPADLLGGCASELFMIGAAVTLVAFGFRFNTGLLTRGLLVSFGASLVAQALLPKREGNSEPGQSDILS